MTERTVRDVLRRDGMVAVEAATTVRAAVRQMARHHVSAVLVMEGKRLCGIFTERDLVERVVGPGLDPETAIMGEVMTANPVTVDLDADVMGALRNMTDNTVRHLPVMDGEHVAGLVALRDFMAGDIARMAGEAEVREELAERMR